MKANGGESMKSIIYTVGAICLFSWSANGQESLEELTKNVADIKPGAQVVIINNSPEQKSNSISESNNESPISINNENPINIEDNSIQDLSSDDIMEQLSNLEAEYKKSTIQDTTQRRRLIERENDTALMKRLEDSRIEDESARLDKVLGLEDEGIEAALPPELSGDVNINVQIQKDNVNSSQILGKDNEQEIEFKQSEVIRGDRPAEVVKTVRLPEVVKAPVADGALSPLKAYFGFGLQMYNDVENVKSGPAVQLGMEYELNPILSVSTELQYSAFYIQEFIHTATLRQARQYSLAAGAKASLPLTVMTPFVGVQLQYAYRNYFNKSTGGQANATGSVDGVLKVGLDYQINSRFNLIGEYRYAANLGTNASDYWENLYGVKALEKFSYSQFLIQVSYRF